MPDFSRPEYQSYVELCRELRLGRQFEEGDQYWREPTVHDQEVLGAKGGVSMYYGNLDWDEAHRSDDRHFWLPALADWLEMLDEAGYSAVLIAQHLGDENAPDGWEIAASGDRSFAPGELGSGQTDAYAAPTREEAAARLWMAVSGSRLDIHGGLGQPRRRAPATTSGSRGEGDTRSAQGQR